MRFPEDVPVLTDGEDLRLRAHRPDDIDDFLAMCCDPDYQAWTDKRLPYSHSDALANVGVVKLAGTLGEIGYWAHPEARGRGVVTAAVGLVVRHAFTPIEYGGLGRHRLELTAAKGNKASQHVALANGFTQSGIRRQASLRRDGTREDLLLFDLLESDDEPFPSP